MFECVKGHPGNINYSLPLIRNTLATIPTGSGMLIKVLLFLFNNYFLGKTPSPVSGADFGRATTNDITATLLSQIYIPQHFENELLKFTNQTGTEFVTFSLSSREKITNAR
jgi:hypothetical protein